MKNKNFLNILIVFSFLFFGSIFFVKAENFSGWFWGGTQSSNNDAYSGVGWIDGKWDANNVNNVKIPQSDGNVTGYAWSEYYGWIDFVPSEPYPSEPNQSVQRVGNKLYGWARILSIANNSGGTGGWQGWIKFGDKSKGDSFEVNLNSQENNFAYSDELGYIDFSGLETSSNVAVSVELSASPRVYLASGEKLEDKTVELSWKISGNPTNCVTSGDWSEEISTITEGKKMLELPDEQSKFSLTCSDGTNTFSDEVLVMVGCYNQECSGNTCVSKFKRTSTYDCSSQCGEDNCASAFNSKFKQKEVAP